MFKCLSRSLVLVAFLCVQCAGFAPLSLAAAADPVGEQNFYVKLEWGIYDASGNPSTAPIDPSYIINLRGDVSMTDSIADLVTTVNFERGEDRIDLRTMNNTYTGFRSRIVRATDGLIFDVTANFSETTAPSLYFWVDHEGRNVTLPLGDLINDEDQKLEYVIDSMSRYKLFIEILSADEVAAY